MTFTLFIICYRLLPFFTLSYHSFSFYYLLIFHLFHLFLSSLNYILHSRLFHLVLLHLRPIFLVYLVHFSILSYSARLYCEFTKYNTFYDLKYSVDNIPSFHSLLLSLSSSRFLLINCFFETYTYPNIKNLLNLQTKEKIRAEKRSLPFDTSKIDGIQTLKDQRLKI